MRILIETNIIIPMEDINISLDSRLAELSRLASGKHELLAHPECYKDIERDKDQVRRESMLTRLAKYNLLESPPVLDIILEESLFWAPKKANDSIDNRILYSLYCNCVHWLVTQDNGVHKKAKKIGVSERVLTLEQVINSLNNIEKERVNIYPNIQDFACHSLDLTDHFFDSLRNGYAQFDNWFNRKCCQAGRHAWVCSDKTGIDAICIYISARQMK
jgi:hypothetical protein